jgi:hypothetical protein
MPPPISPTASASQVRTYLTTILAQEYDVPEEEGQSITEKWRYGKGVELCSFGKETFCEIFGGEVGVLLYRGVSAKNGIARPWGMLSVLFIEGDAWFWCSVRRDGLRWSGAVVKVRVANNFKVGKIDLCIGVMVMAMEGTVFLWVASMFREQA